MQTCIWKRITKCITIDNQVRKHFLCQICRMACVGGYMQNEYVNMNTLFAIGACIIKQWVNFGDVCKKSEISHLDLVYFKDYVLLKEYM